MFITKTALPRRTFLRGIGTTLALPLLDAMVPALTAMRQTAAQPVPRLGFFYVPNGIYPSAWRPVGQWHEFHLGADDELRSSRSAISWCRLPG